tara:strand:+ start:78 stop:257 length:180 start_codon:yes stop_codon:yes gene_type:complete
MDEKYVPFKERVKSSFELRLDKVLKQYSIVKVEGKCIHGKDYREMKRLILDNLYVNDEI